MRETVFQSELGKCLGAAGFWAYKIPDTPMGGGSKEMKVGETGKLRFNLPKPCDLVANSPEGYFVAIECKLERSGVFTFHEHEQEQLQNLLSIISGRSKSMAFFAINYRYKRVTQRATKAKARKTEKVNRAFLITAGALVGVSRLLLWEQGESTDPCDIRVEWIGQELIRITGGWSLHPPSSDF